MSAINFFLSLSSTRNDVSVQHASLASASISPPGHLNRTTFAILPPSTDNTSQLILLTAYFAFDNAAFYQEGTLSTTINITGKAEMKTIIGNNSSCRVEPTASTFAYVFFQCTVAPHPAPMSVVSPTATAMSQAAIGVSIAASAVSGPGAAADMQSMVIVALSRCSADEAVVPGLGTERGYKVLTPFALSDSARGALAGNAAAVGSVLTMQLALFGLFLLTEKKRKPTTRLRTAAARARFPGYSLLMFAAVHQSTLFSAIRLLGHERNGDNDVTLGISALIVSLAFPVLIVVASVRVPRRFVRYDVPPSSRFFSLPLRLLAPAGVTLPEDVRNMCSSLITAFMLATPLCSASTFASSYVTNAIALIPYGYASLCSGALYLSAVLHLVLGFAVAVSGIYRFSSTSGVTFAGLALTAAFHAQIASHWRHAIDATLTVQGALSLFRSAVSGANVLAEWKMTRDPQVQLREVVWEIGSSQVIHHSASDTCMNNSLLHVLDEPAPAVVKADDGSTSSLEDLAYFGAEISVDDEDDDDENDDSARNHGGELSNAQVTSSWSGSSCHDESHELADDFASADVPLLRETERVADPLFLLNATGKEKCPHDILRSYPL